jgi:hypothetical protein
VLILPLEASWRAHRTYVHGTDLYLLLIEAMGRAAPGTPLGGIRINLRKSLQSQPDYAFAQAGEAMPSNAMGDFAVTAEGAPGSGWICASQRPVTRRVAYDEDVIRAGIEFQDAAAFLGQAVPCQPIEAVLSLGVAINNHLSPPGGKRWMLGRMTFLRPLAPPDVQGLKVERRQLLGGQMSRLAVSNAGQPLGELMFSLSDTPSSS